MLILVNELKEICFNFTRSKLPLEVYRKLAELIIDLKSRLKDIKMLSISKNFREHEIQKAAFLE